MKIATLNRASAVILSAAHILSYSPPSVRQTDKLLKRNCILDRTVRMQNGHENLNYE
jgi:hypothetical protein